MKTYVQADPSRQLLLNLQVLRAFAALIVVFVHLSPLLGVLGLPPFGAEGVSLFFVISGYIMVATTSTKPTSPGRFLINRAVRIIPMYWIFTILVAIVGNLRPNLFANTVVSPLNVFRSLFFIPFVRADGTLEPLLFVGWTLNYEVAFYVLFALSLFVRNTHVRVLAVVLSLATLVILGIMVPGERIWRFYTNQIILQFAAGMVIALFNERLKKLTQRLSPFGALILALTVAGLLTFNTYLFPPVVSRTMAGMEAAILVAVAVGLEQTGQRLTWKPALAVGASSYSLYLSHPFVTQSVYALSRRSVGEPLTAFIVILISLLLAILVGHGLHLACELPLSRFGRRVLHVGRLGVSAKTLA